MRGIAQVTLWIDEIVLGALAIGGAAAALWANRKVASSAVWEGNYKAAKARADEVEKTSEHLGAQLETATATIADLSSRPDYTEVDKLMRAMLGQLTEAQKDIVHTITTGYERTGRMMVTEIASQIGAAASGAIAGVVASATEEHTQLLEEMKKHGVILDEIRKRLVNGP